MLIKTAELDGPVLDWAVAFANGDSADALESYIDGMRERDEGNYSTDWAKAGPIIEREQIALRAHEPPTRYPAQVWSAEPSTRDVSARLSCFSTGATPLIAAMRCFVTTKLGQSVDVPDELLEASHDASSRPSL